MAHLGPWLLLTGTLASISPTRSPSSASGAFDAPNVKPARSMVSPATSADAPTYHETTRRRIKNNACLPKVRRICDVYLSRYG